MKKKILLLILIVCSGCINNEEIKPSIIYPDIISNEVQLFINNVPEGLNIYSKPLTIIFKDTLLMENIIGRTISKSFPERNLIIIDTIAFEEINGNNFWKERSIAIVIHELGIYILNRTNDSSILYNFPEPYKEYDSNIIGQGHFKSLMNIHRQPSNNILNDSKLLEYYMKELFNNL